MTEKEFLGETFVESRDRDRLHRQIDAVRELMKDSEWRALETIAALVGAPEASVSARLRDLRRARHGGYEVQRKYLGNGLFTYRVAVPMGNSEAEA